MIRAAAVLIVDGPRVLAFQRYDAVGLSIPCGKIEPGETSAETAIREMEEETGLRVIVDETNPFMGFDNIGNCMVTTYLGTIVGGHLRADAPGEGKAVWASLREIAYGPYWHYNQRLMRHFDFKTPIIGKFHSHLTIKANSEKELDRAAKLCGGKLTTILLQRDGHVQTDAMITHHYRTDARGIEDEKDIVALLRSRALLLTEAGVKVTRLKLEYDVTSEHNSPHDASQACLQGIYTEVHVKCVVVAHERDHLMARAREFGWHPSHNPLSIRDDEKLIQFVNMRFYGSATMDAIDKEVDRLIPTLLQMAEIEEIKYETAVFDSNEDVDKWWMKQN